MNRKIVTSGLAATFGLGLALAAGALAQSGTDYYNSTAGGYGRFNNGYYGTGIISMTHGGQIGVQVTARPDRYAGGDHREVVTGLTRDLGTRNSLFGSGYSLGGLFDGAEDEDVLDPVTGIEGKQRDRVADSLWAYKRSSRSLKANEFQVATVTQPDGTDLITWTTEATTERVLPATLTGRCGQLGFNPAQAWPRGTVDQFKSKYFNTTVGVEDPAVAAAMANDVLPDDFFLYSTNNKTFAIVDNLSDSGQDGIICGKVDGVPEASQGHVFGSGDYDNDGQFDLIAWKINSVNANNTNSTLSVLFLEDDGQGGLQVRETRSKNLTIGHVLEDGQSGPSRNVKMMTYASPDVDGEYHAVGSFRLDSAASDYDRRKFDIEVERNYDTTTNTYTLGDMSVRVSGIIPQ